MTRRWSPIRRRSPSQVGTTCTPKHRSFYIELVELPQRLYGGSDELRLVGGLSPSIFLSLSAIHRRPQFVNKAVDYLLNFRQKMSTLRIYRPDWLVIRLSIFQQ